MGATTAAERKATERINRQVQPWRYRAELEHAIGMAAGRALAHGDTIARAELVERAVLLLVQSSNDAAHKLLKAHMVSAEDLPPVETMRGEAADCLHRHFVTVTEEEAARCREFDARLAAATGRTQD
jgi:hypothetical protein